MKKSFIVLLHLGFWACFFVLIVIMLTVYYRSSLYASASSLVAGMFYLLTFVSIPTLALYGPIHGLSRLEIG